MAPQQMAIPQPFSYLLPGQGLVAGVAIYSTIYVFGVGKIPFILAVVAAGLHFLLGVYFCFTKNRLRAHDFFLVPLVLVAGAGVWAGSLYYFAKLLGPIIRLGSFFTGTTSQPEIATWTKVGTSMTGLNVLIDIILVIVFIVAASKKSSPYPAQEPTYVPPQAPAPAPTFPVAPPVTVQYQQPQQQYQQQQYYQVATVPVIQQQQQQQQPPPAPERIMSTTSSDFKLPIASSISPATSPSPSQQYQPYQQPQTAQYQHQRQQSYTSQQQQSYIPQYQQQQQQQSPFSPQPPQSFSPSPQPPPTPPQPQRQQQPQSYETQNQTQTQTQNRITTLRRLSSLQNPLGNWTYTPELASILQTWSGHTITPNTPPYDVTVLTHALMFNLRDYIWSAQREGWEHSALSPAELESLRGVNWDLSWVGMGIDRAGGWLTQGQGQGQGQGQSQGGYR